MSAIQLNALLISLAVAVATNSSAGDRQPSGSQAAEQGSILSQANRMKIRIMVSGTELTGTLDDNPTAKDFASLLPMTVRLKDYGHAEKISDLPKKLTTIGAPSGVEPAVGDIAYYAPWGNLALFRENFAYSRGLIKLGRIDSGIQTLSRSGEFTATIELVPAKPMFPRLESEMRNDLVQGIIPGKGLAPSDAVFHIIAVFRTLWRYRFFFDALNNLLKEEEELRTRYLALQASIMEAAEGAMNWLIEHAEMRAPAAPTTTRMLARNWWLMWLGWLSIEHMEHPHLEMVPNGSLFDGALQSHSIVQPYFDPAFTAAFVAELEKGLFPKGRPQKVITSKPKAKQSRAPVKKQRAAVRA